MSEQYLILQPATYRRLPVMVNVLPRRPGVYSKLHGLQNFREGLVSLEEGATMDTIVARIRSSLTDSSTPSAAEVAAATAVVAKVGDAISPRHSAAIAL